MPSLLDLLSQTWPARAAKGILGGLALPGDVYAGRVDPLSPEGIGRATDLAGGIMGGTFASAPAGALGSGLVRRPYQGVSDQLMGFRRNGPQRGFEQEGFSHLQPVKVTFPDGEVMVDAIKGLNQPHALERARRNWDAQKIEPITHEEARSLGLDLSQYQ